MHSIEKDLLTKVFSRDIDTVVIDKCFHPHGPNNYCKDSQTLLYQPYYCYCIVQIV